MDELKNLVIQTLETNGILGQLRAQLRSCVFKVIDNQEQVEKGQSTFHWENPNARKVMQTASGVICAELIREFLEFYRLDYSLQIYLPEVNLAGSSAANKEDLARRAGLAGSFTENKPIMVQLLENFLIGDRSAAAPAAPQQEVIQKQQQQPAHQSNSVQQNFRKDEFEDRSGKKSGSPENFFSSGANKNQTSAAAASKKSDQERRLEIASQMLEEQSQEEKSGFRAEIQKSEQSKSSNHSPSPVAPPSRQAMGAVKQEKSNEFADNYGDDFEDDDIQEDIKEDHENDYTDNQVSGSGNNNLTANAGAGHKTTFISESMGGITVSQSLGVDPSVDSLALEDYDHIEPVERVNY